VRIASEDDMTESGADIGEQELNGYIDGQLGPEEQIAVERYLKANPTVAHRVATDLAQRKMLRAAFSSYLTQPLPPELHLNRLVEARLQRRSRVAWQIAAAAVLSLGIGGAGGWMLHTSPRSDRATLAMEALDRQALASHAVFVPDHRHPIEVPAAERDHLAQWLSNRLNRSVSPPDLSSFGYRLMGGRLLATEQGNPAALFVYEDSDGNRISLLMRPMAADLHVPIAQWDRNDVNACSWIDKGMGYAILGPVPTGDLERMARDIGTKKG
jgi:anti-sigma factor RsiW